MEERKKSELIIYQTEDGVTKINVTLENDTVWLTQAQMAELFETNKSTISRHISNIFEEGKLDIISTCKTFLQGQIDGEQDIESVIKFNLKMITSVGDRVNSQRSEQFCEWARRQIMDNLAKEFLNHRAQTPTLDEQAFVDAVNEAEETVKKALKR